MKNLAVLGSTGSIGTQAIKVVERYPDSLNVVALAAGSNIELLVEQIRAHKPAIVSVMGPDEAIRLKNLVHGYSNQPEIVYGCDGLREIVNQPQVESVLNGLVGATGFIPTLTALRKNKEVLLANKESLVMAGGLIRNILDSGNGSIVPVDSEHSAIYQCINGNRCQGLARLILTASGGPFRTRPVEEFENISVKEALNHPTWKMGPKVTIDSATLVNKGLEIIEAHYLFGLPPDKIDVVIHPASIVHSLVEFDDGSMLAQLSHPTMDVPIQYALLGGERRETSVKKLDLVEVGRLEFYAPDNEKFPSLDLARHALREGGTAPAVFNGANEEAVSQFLAERISFVDILKLVESALMNREKFETSEEGILEADNWARNHVKTRVSGSFMRKRTRNGRCQAEKEW